MIKHLKSSLFFTLIIAAGVACGFGICKLPGLLKPAYVEGNYAAYFPAGANKVAVYGTAWCQYCAQTRAYLQQHAVAFSNFDVEKSKTARLDYAQLHGDRFPVVLIGNRRIDGFDPKAMDAALKAIGATLN